MGLKSIFKRRSNKEKYTTASDESSTAPPPRVATPGASHPTSLTTSETAAIIRHGNDPSRCGKNVAEQVSKRGKAEDHELQGAEKVLRQVEQARERARCDECRRRQEICVSCYRRRALTSHPMPLGSHPDGLLCEAQSPHLPRVQFAVRLRDPIPQLSEEGPSQTAQWYPANSLLLVESSRDGKDLEMDDVAGDHDGEYFFCEVRTVGVAVIARGATIVNIPPMRRPSTAP